MTSRRRAPWLVGSLAVVALLGACSSEGVGTLPPPPTTRPLESTTTTTPPDYAAVRLEGVSGRDKTTVALGPGQASLGGTVLGPDGAVPGAVVHVERLVGDASAVTDVTSATDGRWALTGVLGGRYRVRAWRSPDLAQVDAQVLFVEATESRQLSLVTTRFGETTAAAAVAPNPPLVNQASNIAVRLSQRRVDERGIVRTVPPLRAAVQLVGPGNWAIVSPNPMALDATGAATWNVVCLSPGPQPLDVAVGEAVFPLNLPPCAESA